MVTSGYFHRRILFSSVLKTGLVFLLMFGSRSSSQPLAEGQSKFLGNVIGYYGVLPNFSSYWNQVTPENSGKWGPVETGQDIYSWGGLDQIYNYALENNFPFKHHNLIWGQQQPNWIAYIDDSTQKAEEVEEWIRLVAERYPDMDCIDVVNEPLHSPPKYYKDAMGGDGSTGWDWVIWAFQKARQYCSPGVKLILNDYNIINDNYSTDQYLEIINLLKERDLIDGIGVEGHYFEFRDASTSTLKSNLDKLAATGLSIYISEFEVDLEDDEAQLQKYKELFPVLWEHPSVVGITLWGYVEDLIWKTHGYLIRSNGSERPALEWLRTYLNGTGVTESERSLPETISLHQNFPNPFNPLTTVRFSLHQPSIVLMTVSDASGRNVRTLIHSRQGAGEHEVVWDGKDDQDNPVSSGVYFYRLTAGSFNLQKKMVLLR